MSEHITLHYAHPEARRRLWVGTLMVVVAALFLGEQAFFWFQQHSTAAYGLQESLLAGAATGVGALPVLFFCRSNPRTMPVLLGLAAGMMLSASIFSLLLPAFHLAFSQHSPFLFFAVLLALVGGGWSMRTLDRRLAHVHLEHLEPIETRFQKTPTRQGALLLVALAFHNFPEGMAVGVAAMANENHGLTFGIALQNLPEGWMVASVLLAMGFTPVRSALIAFATGMVEPIGGLFGVLASGMVAGLLPIALAAAAGAMLWVVVHETIPAVRSGENKNRIVVAIAGGAALMSVLTLCL